MKLSAKRSRSRVLRFEQLDRRWLLSANPFSFSNDDGQQTEFRSEALRDAQRADRDAPGIVDRSGIDRNRAPGRRDAGERFLNDPQTRDGSRNSRPPRRGERSSFEHNHHTDAGRQTLPIAPSPTESQQPLEAVRVVTVVVEPNEVSTRSTLVSTSSNRTPIELPGGLTGPIATASGLGVDQNRGTAVPATANESELLLVSITPSDVLRDLNLQAIDNALETNLDSFAEPRLAEALDAIDLWLDQAESVHDKIDKIDQTLRELAEEDATSETEPLPPTRGTESTLDHVPASGDQEASQQWLLESSGFLLESELGPRRPSLVQSTGFADLQATNGGGWALGIGVYKAFESALPMPSQPLLSAGLLPEFTLPPMLHLPADPQPDSGQQRSGTWYSGAAIAAVAVAGVANRFLYLRKSTGTRQCPVARGTGRDRVSADSSSYSNL